MDNAAISGAIKDVFEHCRTVLEPAGAVAVAGAKAYLKARPHLQVCVCSRGQLGLGEEYSLGLSVFQCRKC